MSAAKSRTQYMFIEVKKSSTFPSVALYGPTNTVNGMVTNLGFDHSGSSMRNGVRCMTSSFGNTAELRLTVIQKDVDNTMFLKASLLEEALRFGSGFKLLSNITDDFMIFTREVTY